MMELILMISLVFANPCLLSMTAAALSVLIHSRKAVKSGSSPVPHGEE